VLMNILQPAPTLWATMQLGFFRSIDLPALRLLSPGKLPLPGFAPRPLRPLNQFPTGERRRLALPRPLQLFHFRMQKLVLLSQFLDRFESLNQLLLQFSYPLVFRAGLGVLDPLVAHQTKCNAFSFLIDKSNKRSTIMHGQTQI